ncbi:BZ3500_MvSof-1268-A1-R1_Chr6-2g08566 [Microbotryum saponariae]|uniref:BZ3500_MvSof-1268-A1-R1_Chr6-2g08566 protein n=1 Tax=Microbotryum saponariae TaxID=289078 RepID=A0A2X0MGI3_9BASI|nr:BZ3500_MvSof-1268-A1-R1_Chr6-2g08566 [Microbotryum saponariae]
MTPDSTFPSACSTRARRPPDYLGFARVAHDLEFAAHASVSIEDFDEDDPEVQLWQATSEGMTSSTRVGTGGGFQEVSAVAAAVDKGATEEGSRSKGSQEIKYNGLNSQTIDKKRRGNKREERTKLPGKGGKTKGKGLCQAQMGLSQINHSKRSPQG